MAKLAEDIEDQITRALAEAQDFYDDEVATSVRYVASGDLFLLVLKSGRRIAIPREDLQDVADASREDAAEVRLEMLNSAVHWEKLDVDFSVKGLADGLRGGERWMKQLAERQELLQKAS